MRRGLEKSYRIGRNKKKERAERTEKERAEQRPQKTAAVLWCSNQDHRGFFPETTGLREKERILQSFII